jgi:uncharacterized protein (UPF0216 family)
MITHKQDQDTVPEIVDQGQIEQRRKDLQAKLLEQVKLEVAIAKGKVVVIERSELERLQALERKLEAFFDSISAVTMSAFEIQAGDKGLFKIAGDPNVRLASDDGAEWHDGLGGAMFKAFELFEVSEDK